MVRKAESKKVVQRAEKRLLDIKQDSLITFEELTTWYLGLQKVKALSSFWRLKLAMDRFNSEFGGTIVSRLKPADLENCQAKRSAEKKAPATIDQEIGAAKNMVYKAFDNGLVAGDTLKTFKVIKKLLKRNTNARKRVLTPPEFQSLMVNASRHLKGILAAAYYTGMREGEILHLTWDKVDLKNSLIQLAASDTKDKEPRTIPICDELLEVMKSIPRSIQGSHVFLHRGGPVVDIRGTLKKACKGSEITYGRFAKDGFIFHDLRRTFNTNMRKAGVAESVIMAVTGHSTREMFDRYNTVDVEDTRGAVNRLQEYVSNVDQTVDQAAKDVLQYLWKFLTEKAFYH